MVTKKALVTGATGYIGSCLVSELLSRGWDVHVIVRRVQNKHTAPASLPEVTSYLYTGSIENLLTIVEQARPDVVFHLASDFIAEHQPVDVLPLIQNNIGFGAQLLEAMAINKTTKIVNTGTTWQNHNNKNFPTNLYAATKQAFESIIDFYVDAHKFSVTTLYLFDVYGPKDPRKKLIPLLCRAAKSGESLAMSPGGQMIDLVHVNDVVDAFILAASQIDKQSALHMKYKVSSGQPATLFEIVNKFTRYTKKSVNIEWGKRPYRAREVMIASSSFDSVPGWRPKISLKSGLISATVLSESEEKK